MNQFHHSPQEQQQINSINLIGLFPWGPLPSHFNLFSINLSILKEEIDGRDEMSWAGQPSSSIIKQINFTLLNCFIV